MKGLIVAIREKCNLRNGFAIWHLSFMFGTTGKAVQLAKKASQQLVAWAWFPVRTYRRREKRNMHLVQPFSWIQSPMCIWKVLALCYQCSYQRDSSHGASSTKKRRWVSLIIDTPHRVREQKWTWCLILCNMQYVFGIYWINQQFPLVQRFPTWGTCTPYGYTCLSEGVLLRLTIEEKYIFIYISFISKYLYIYQWIFFSKIIICLF